MTKWTFVALAVTVAACNKGERDRVSENKSDTAAMVAGAAADSTVSADSTRAHMTASDTATAKPSARERATTKAATTKPPATGTKTEAPTGTGAARDNGPSGAEAMTGVRAGVTPRELSADDVKQLQSALKKAGCYSGTPDGVSGPGTQRAIDCGLKKYNLAAGDTDALYRKLGLKF